MPRKMTILQATKKLKEMLPDHRYRVVELTYTTYKGKTKKKCSLYTDVLKEHFEGETFEEAFKKLQERLDKDGNK